MSYACMWALGYIYTNICKYTYSLSIYAHTCIHIYVSIYVDSYT